jgi:hypothetical protein
MKKSTKSSDEQSAPAKAADKSKAASPSSEMGLTTAGVGWVTVLFRESRQVLQGDVVLGNTNEDINVAAGQYTLTLSGPKDFAPGTRVVLVKPAKGTDVTFE